MKTYEVLPGIWMSEAVLESVERLTVDTVDGSHKIWYGCITQRFYVDDQPLVIGSHHVCRTRDGKIYTQPVSQ